MPNLMSRISLLFWVHSVQQLHMCSARLFVLVSKIEDFACQYMVLFLSEFSNQDKKEKCPDKQPSALHSYKWQNWTISCQVLSRFVKLSILTETTFAQSEEDYLLADTSDWHQPGDWKSLSEQTLLLNNLVTLRRNIQTLSRSKQRKGYTR